LKTTSQLILENLIKNDEFHGKTIPFLKQEYFEDIAEQVLFKHISEYSQKYRRVPTFEALFIDISNDKKVNEDASKRLDELFTELKPDTEQNDIQWLLTTTEEFCQDRAIYNALQKAIDIADGGDKKLSKGAIPDLFKEALSVSFQTSLGHDIFENAESRHEYYHKPKIRVPFNLTKFNEITKGGFAKKTLNLFLAGTHVGKTAIMIHQAASNLADGKTIVYFTLEMAEEEIAKRVDANLMGLDIDDVLLLPKDRYLQNINGIKAKHTGRLIVKEFPTGQASINHFRHFLSELYLKKNIVPDVVYVDYLNLCSSARLSGGHHNSYSLMKAVSEELRGLAMELNLCIVSASQFNRGGAENSDPEMGDISESFGVAFTADFIAALVVTDELKEQDKMMVKQLKNRYDDMNRQPRFVLGYKRSKAKFYDAESDGDKGFTKREDSGIKVTESPKLHEMLKKKREGSFSSLKV
jgi:replicative DNA helicase